MSISILIRLSFLLLGFAWSSLHAVTSLPAAIKILGITINMPTNNSGQAYQLYANGRQQAPINIRVWANQKIDQTALLNALYLYRESDDVKLPWQGDAATEMTYSNVRNRWQFGIFNAKSGDSTMLNAPETPSILALPRGTIPTINRQQFYFTTPQQGTIKLCAAIATSQGELKTCEGTSAPDDVTIQAIAPIVYHYTNFTGWATYNRFFNDCPQIWCDRAVAYEMHFNNSVQQHYPKLASFTWKGPEKFPYNDGSRISYLKTPAVKYDTSARVSQINVDHNLGAVLKSYDTTEPWTGYILTGGGGWGFSYWNVELHDAKFTMCDEYGNCSDISYNPIELG